MAILVGPTSLSGFFHCIAQQTLFISDQTVMESRESECEQSYWSLHSGSSQFVVSSDRVTEITVILATK